MKLLLIYPHQLFSTARLPRDIHAVWLVEDPLFFYDPVHAPAFHRQKLILHRTSMRCYADHLTAERFAVEYHEYAILAGEGTARAAEKLLRLAYRAGFREVRAFDPVDYLLERRLRRAAERTGMTLSIMDTPAFLTTRADNLHYIRQHKRYYQTAYYIWQRKRLNILLTGEGMPIGGRWTYDIENRRCLPAGHLPPPIHPAVPDSYIIECLECHFHGLESV